MQMGTMVVARPAMPYSVLPDGNGKNEWRQAYTPITAMPDNNAVMISSLRLLDYPCACFYGLKVEWYVVGGIIS